MATEDGRIVEWAEYGQLIELGYTHEHIDADWEDVGGPENGPCLQGHGEYDAYTSDEDYVFIENGRAFYEKRNKEWEDHVATMFG